MPEKKYTDEILTYIKQNKNKGYDWLLDKLNSEFNLNTTRSGLKTTCTAHKIPIKRTYKYPPETIEFIKNNSIKGSRWIQKELKNKYNLNLSNGMFRAICNKFKIKIKNIDPKTIYTNEVLDFIRDNAQLGSNEIIKKLKKEFNIEVTTSSLRSTCYRHKISIWCRGTKYTPEIVDFIKQNFNKGIDYLLEQLAIEYDIYPTRKNLLKICNRNGLYVPVESKYTFEVVEFLRENINSYTWEELCEIIKKDYNIEATVSGICTVCYKYKISKSRNLGIYTPEIIEFIKQNSNKGTVWLIDNIKKTFNINTDAANLSQLAYKKNFKIAKYRNGLNQYVRDFIVEHYNTCTFKELADLVNKEFNINTSQNKIRAMCHNFLDLEGYDRQYYLNKKKPPVGTERILNCKDGPRIYIRYRDLPVTSDTKNEHDLNWMKKTRYVWEQYNEPIPKGYNVVQLDGDFMNCNIENLRCVSKSVLMKINKMYGLGIITDAMIEICQLEEDIKSSSK